MQSKLPGRGAMSVRPQISHAGWLQTVLEAQYLVSGGTERYRYLAVRCFSRAASAIDRM
jgi:hypothetical protein